MNIDIAEQWALELESGKYEQGQSYLSRDGRFCCLGVLCEMALQSGVDITTENLGAVKEYSGHDVYPPFEVKAWAGLKAASGEYAHMKHLTFDNDNGKTFAEIAQIIRANAENL